MKKQGVIFLLFLPVLILSLFLISAQSPDNPTPSVNTGGLVDESGVHTDNINVTSTLTPYKSQAELRLEWLNEKTQFLTPVFHFTIGSDIFGFSWLFALTLFIWLFFVSSFYTILTSFSTFSKSASSIMSVILGVVLANIGFIKATVNAIDYLLKAWWAWLIAIGIIIALLMVEVQIRKMMKKTKENQKKFQEELDRQRLHNETKALGKATEGFKDGAGI